MTSRRLDASFKLGRLSNCISEELFELWLDGKIAFHTLSFFCLQKKKRETKSQVEARHPVSLLPVASLGQQAFNWALGVGACVVCAWSVSK